MLLERRKGANSAEFLPTSLVCHADVCAPRPGSDVCVRQACRPIITSVKDFFLAMLVGITLTIGFELLSQVSSAAAPIPDAEQTAAPAPQDASVY